MSISASVIVMASVVMGKQYRDCGDNHQEGEARLSWWMWCHVSHQWWNNPPAQRRTHKTIAIIHDREITTKQRQRRDSGCSCPA
ncbi:TPA: hypothetical protein JLK48_002066 [Escherichia coli]|uniref:hypothetical protein n=1 Tax=Escherichia coli TaxID=562 RepID=UPI0018DE5300|nr:hypothetical protein [Escherichia coli]EGM7821957.1 hypothetical protein [Escherichia coli]MBH9599408.1 hypothetical protein [Escherichia coli]HAL9795332.1 hypothetical protein [Escherichia coli]HAW0789487.1 hypothetical protein [Escherichia coli]